MLLERDFFVLEFVHFTRILLFKLSSLSKLSFWNFYSQFLRRSREFDEMFFDGIFS